MVDKFINEINGAIKEGYVGDIVVITNILNVRADEVRESENFIEFFKDDVELAIMHKTVIKDCSYDFKIEGKMMYIDFIKKK